MSHTTYYILHTTKTSNLVLAFIFTAVLLGLIIPISKAAAMTISSSNSASYKQGIGINRGLVGWWTMDGADIVGSSVIEKSGVGSVGISHGGVNKVMGKIGQGILLDGTTGYVQSPAYTATNFNQSDPFTLSTWVKITASSTGYIFNKQKVGGSAFSLGVFIGYSFPCFTVAEQNVIQGAIICGGTPMTPNKWYHVVATGDGTNETVYVNGVKVAGPTAYGFSGATQAIDDLYFGEAYNGAARLNGALDDFRIYNRVLSSTEIKQLYAMGGGKISSAVVPTLKTGLTGWWTFDGSETTSGASTDKSGNGKNGVILGTTTVATGKFGQALNFNGSYAGNGSSVDLPGSVINTLNAQANGISYVAWIKSKTASVSQGIIGGKATAGHDYYSNGGILDYSGNAAMVVWAPGYLFTQGTTVLKDNIWYFVVGTYNPVDQKQRIYLNGKLEGTSAAITTYGFSSGDSGTVNIGKMQANSLMLLNNYFFNGSIDDVRIYNRTLSAAEIKQLYGAGGDKIQATTVAKGGSLTSGLVGHWTFDGADTTATTALDKSGQNNTGTRNGGTSITNGKIGQAMKFNGVNGTYVDLGLTYGTLTNNFTLSFWVNSKNTTIGGRIIAKRDIDAGGGQFDYYIGTGKQGFFNGVTTYSASSTVSSNKWHLVTAVINGSNSHFYLDGNPDGNTLKIDTSGSQPSIKTTIGALWWTSQGGANAVFNGSMDDARIYNRALSAQEVKQLYAMGK